MAERSEPVGNAEPGAPGQPRQPLLPGRLRRRAIVIIAVCAVITAVLAVLVYHQNGAGFMDRKIDHLLHHSIGRFPGILRPLADLGELVPVTLMAAGLAVICLLLRRWEGAVLVAVGTAAAAVVTEYLLKPLVGRTLGGGDSFPSGHATAMFALATAFFVLLAAPPPRLKLSPRLRRALTVAAAVIAACVPVAMVGLNHHYFTDIVAGTAVGIAMVLLTALALDAIASWRAGKAPGNRPHTGTTAPGSGSERATVGA